jgi:hypothetical protein
MFLDEIIERIPRWKASPDMLELDHQIQRFSIEFSEKINDDQQRENKSTTISLTPLSVYVLTFEVLHFLSASTLVFLHKSRKIISYN